MKLPRLALPLSVFGTAVGVIVIIRDKRQGPCYISEQSIAGRTVVVTGANSGIGKATAKELARRGGRIILACRDIKSGLQARDEIIEETFNRNIEVKELDLASLESIVKFAQGIIKSEKRLDVLVNNAGIIGGKRALTKDGFESNLGINFLGPFLLTNLLLPKLKESHAGRVVNVTSISQVKGKIEFDDLNGTKKYDSYAAYAQSKLALMLFTAELGERCSDSHVTTYAVYPGLTKTRLARGLHDSYISSALVGSPLSIFMRTPENAAQTIVYCCVEPSLGKTTGKYYKDLQEIPHDVDKEMMNCKRLWLVAERWTRLEENRKLLSQNTNTPRT